jgi:hypothetical protein
MMRSVLSLAIARSDQSTSAAERGRMSATLLPAGMMAEALPAVERAAVTCRHLESYKARALPLLKDPQRTDTNREWMSPLRNKAVFHHDREVSVGGLQLLKAAVPQTMVSSTSPMLLDMYYPLADVAAIMYMIQNSDATDRPWPSYPAPSRPLRTTQYGFVKPSMPLSATQWWNSKSVRERSARLRANVRCTCQRSFGSSLRSHFICSFASELGR